MTKHIDVTDVPAEPLPKGYGFSILDESEIAADPGPDASVFDSGSISRMNQPLVGMAPRRRDPAAGMIPQAFIRKHGGLPFGYTVAEESALIQNFIARHGLRLIPPGAAATAAGKRWVTPSEEARLRHYKPVPGDATYKAQEQIRLDAGVYEDRLSVQESEMSLSEGKYARLAWDSTIKGYRQAVPKSQKLPKEGKLPDRPCQNPECFNEIDEKEHHNVKCCSAKCTARAKELRRLDRKNQKAGRPIHYRNESDVSAAIPGS
jgi:hypothetical protein